MPYCSRADPTDCHQQQLRFARFVGRRYIRMELVKLFVGLRLAGRHEEAAEMLSDYAFMEMPKGETATGKADILAFWK